MAVSKRLRYEVLRRDGHACKYCGGAAPDVTLTVDHVVPVALGGTDDPGNLVTACTSCNSGKSATVPDGPLVRDVDETALRWSRAMTAAAEAVLADLDKREQAYGEFDDEWSSWTYGTPRVVIPRPPDWRRSVDSFVAAGLPMPILLESVRRAMESRKVAPASTWRYMCGIAWARVTELQKAARQAAETPDAPVTIDTNLLVQLIPMLLEDLFEGEPDYYIDMARAESGDLPPGDIHVSALTAAIRELRNHDMRMTQATLWAAELLAERDAQPLRVLAEAHCADLLGQYKDSDIAGCMVFLARHPDKRAAVEARLREHDGGSA